ncbi:MAG: SDR family oxidoreductase [Flavobacteriaceae bacterium]|nr:SDR family oxidoreductase [Flavobacteriaceae bacterium]
MKNIIITGCSRGIGFELVKYFSNPQYQIIAIARNVETITQLKMTNVTPFKADITNEKDLKALKIYIEKTWTQVDIVIHNAGKLLNKPFFKTTTADFIDIYKVNVFAVAELTRLLIPFLKKGSHVVTISSMGGIQNSLKFAGLSAYTSSKGALITLTELLAEEYSKSGISFNVLALGAVQTEMLKEAFPKYKALVNAEEMAHYIGEFSLKGNKYFNGKVLQVSSTTP